MLALNLLMAELLVSAVQMAPDDVLARARPQLLQAVERLPKYTCTETIDRSYTRRITQVRRPGSECDPLIADRMRGIVQYELSATDRLRLEVAIADSGKEVYSWPGARRIESEDTELLTGGGPFGTGSFGPFLIDIFNNPGVSIEYIGNRRMGRKRESRGENWFEYRFRVPLSSSHYEIKTVRGRVPFPYDGSFWLDATSGELKRLLVRTTELPGITGACEATTTIDFSRAMLGRNEFTLPRESKLQIVMRNGDESENTTRLSNCHEYLSESVVHFEGELEPKAGLEDNPRAPAKPLPAGLAVALRLETEIDTDVAAVGDPVIARLARDVIDRESPDDPLARVLVRAGTLARGRIIKLEHYIEGRPAFLIALRFETLEVDGAVIPLQVKLPSKLHTASMRRVVWDISSRTMLPQTGTFVIRTGGNKYVLPRGHESNWVTFRPVS